MAQLNSSLGRLIV